MMTTLKATNFSLSDQDGKIHSLSDYLGKWVVLYFYPKDDTPGCTTEACGFRDSFAQLQKKNIMVLGVSRDSVDSHKNFADKFHLNFPLLSDEKSDTIKAYEAWNENPLPRHSPVLRKTFLINPEGEIFKEYPKVDPLTHAHQILSDVENS